MTLAAPPMGVAHPRVAADLATGAVAGILAAGLFVGGPRAAIAGALAIAFLVLTGIETKVLTYFVALPLVGWLKVRYPATNVQGIPDILALATLLNIGWSLLVRRLRLPFANPFVAGALLFAVAVLIQSQNPITAAVGQGLDGARVYLEPFVLFLAGLAVFRRPGFVERWLAVLVVTATIVGAYAMKQVVFGLAAAERAFQQESAIRTVAEKKIFSTLASPDGFGFVAAAFVLVCLVARSRGVLPRLSLLAVAMNGIGAVASGLRIAVIGLAPGLVLLLVLQLREPRTRAIAVRTGAMVVAVAVVLTAVVVVTPVGRRDDSFDTGNAVEAAVVKLALLKAGRDDTDYQGRADRLGLFLAFMGHHPLGAGPGIVGLVDASTDLDPTVARPNLPDHILREPWIFQHDFYYFSVGVELGLLPLLLLLLLLLAGVALAIDALPSAPDRSSRAALQLAASVTLLAIVYSATNEAFRTPQVAGYVWFVLAAPVVWWPTLSRPLVPVEVD